MNQALSFFVLNILLLLTNTNNCIKKIDTVMALAYFNS